MRAFALLPLLLVGCNKTKDTSDTASDTGSSAANHAPVANAGTDQSQPADHLVTLSGAASTDADGDALTYFWAFDYTPAGSTVTSRDAPFSVNHGSESVTTFQPDVVGTYVISLTVRDSHGSASAPDYVVVTAAQPDNLPVANAGADTSGSVGSTVTLDGTRSYDPQGHALTFAWSLVARPEGSTLAGLTDPTTNAPSFVPDIKGVYIASLVVNNGTGDSRADAVTITVTSDDHEPVANAGADIEGEDCTTYTLDCAASSDPDGDSLQYYWSVQLKPTGSAVTDDTFSDRTSARPSFYPDVAGAYVLSCAVYDGTSWGTPDTVHLDAAERVVNSPPTVDAGRDVAVDAGSGVCEQSGYLYNCEACSDQTVALGSDAVVTDDDGDPLTIEWTVVSGDATIADPHSISTQVTITDLEPEEPGTCVDSSVRFELTVTDCTGATVTDRVTYTATCCGVSESG